MKKSVCLLLSFCLALCTAHAAMAGVVKVTPGGGDICSLDNTWGQCGDLQAAIDAAQDGHQVWVAAGTYLPTTTTDRAISIVMKGSVQLYGGFDGTETELSQRDHSANPTFLSGDIGAPDVDTDNSLTVVIANDLLSPACLDGFIIEKATLDGDALPGELDNYGGGVYGKDTHLTIRNCLFRHFKTYTFGEALALYIKNGSLDISDTEFRQIQCAKGQGLVHAYFADVTMRRCGFYNNSYPRGSGIIIYKSTSVIEQCTFKNNSVTSSSDALLAMAFTNASIRDSIFANNTLEEGSVLYVSESGYSYVLENSSISDNTINNGKIIGARYATTLTLRNVTVSNNSSTYSGVSNRSSVLNIAGSTFTGNICTNDPCGTIQGNYENGSNPAPPSTTISSTILWGNTGAGGVPVDILNLNGTSQTANNSVVQSGYGDSGIISDAPLLVGPKTRLVNGLPQTYYGLGCGSPAIDGLNGITFPRDQLGTSRPVGLKDDIGAIEMPAACSHFINVTTQGFGSGHVLDNTGELSTLYNGDAKAYPSGYDITLVATPEAGSAFDSWSGDCSSTSGNQCFVTGLNADKTVTANFKRAYPLTISHGGNGQGAVTSTQPGIDCPGDCSEAYDFNTPVTLNAQAAAGSEFAGWAGVCTGLDTLCSVTMTEARSVVASFNALDQGLTCDAGPDKTTKQGRKVTLYGASKSSSPVTSWAWTQESGSALTLSDADTNIVSFTPADAGTYTLRLTVQTANGQTYTDTVNVIVLETASTNNPPVAETGAVQNVAPGTAVQLDGTSSRDPEAGALTYLWEQISGPAPVTLTGAATATPSFTPTVEGGYSFRLTVADPQGNKAGSTAIVNVFINHTPPVARIIATCAGDWCTLDARNSTDSHGRTFWYYANNRNAGMRASSAFSYRWVQTQGEAVALQNPYGEVALFPSASKTGVQTFKVTITDSLGAMAADTVSLAPPPLPQPSRVPMEAIMLLLQ